MRKSYSCAQGINILKEHTQDATGLSQQASGRNNNPLSFRGMHAQVSRRRRHAYRYNVHIFLHKSLSIVNRVLVWIIWWPQIFPAEAHGHKSRGDTSPRICDGDGNDVRPPEFSTYNVLMYYTAFSTGSVLWSSHLEWVPEYQNPQKSLGRLRHVYGCTVHIFLHKSPNSIVNRVLVWIIWWPQIFPAEAHGRKSRGDTSPRICDGDGNDVRPRPEFSTYIVLNNAVCRLLWSPYVIGQTIIFLPCDFFLLLLLFFPRLISEFEWFEAPL